MKVSNMINDLFPRLQALTLFPGNVIAGHGSREPNNTILYECISSRSYMKCCRSIYVYLCIHIYIYIWMRACHGVCVCQCNTMSHCARKCLCTCVFACVCV